jgi:hypothetical protein
VFYIESTGTKTLTYTDNTFKMNAAISGGSIYCETCGWTMLRNTFSSNIAYNGGQLFIKNPTAAITFDSHSFTDN